MTPACSASESAQTSESPDGIPASFDGVEKLWHPDLDEDGEPDLMGLKEQQIRFAVSRNGDGYLDVVGEDGDELVVTIGDGVTVTCQSEGAVVQTFEPPSEDTATGPLRSHWLEIDGSVGVLTPNPSFFFGPDFDLPDLGAGCRASE